MRNRREKYYYVWVMGIAALFGGAFWLADGIYQYYFFHKNLKFLLLEGPESLLDSIAFNVPPRAIVVRISFIIACLIGGLLVTVFLHRQREAQKRLTESESQLSRAQQIAKIGSWTWDLKTNEFKWSDEMYRVFGLTPGDPEHPNYETFMSRVHPEDRELVTSTLETSSKKKEFTDFEFRTAPIDGQERIVHAYGEVICDDSGKPIRMIGTDQDITEHKQAEEALKESEGNLRTLVESSTDSILTLDPDRRITSCNSSFLNQFGYSRYEVIGQSVSMIHLSTESFVLFGQTVYPVIARKGFWRGEWKLKRKDGSIFPCEIVNSAMKRSDGSIHGYVPILRDITERKRTDEALRDSEKKYRLLVENLPNVVFKGYKDWSIDVIDDKIELFTGYRKEDFNSRKMKWRDIVIEEDIESMQKALIGALKTDKSYVREYRIKTKTGDIRWVQEGSQIVCDEKGEIEFITGAFINVTERKQAEEKIKEYSENLEGMVDERTRELEAAQEGMLNLVEDLSHSKDELEEKAVELEEMNIKIQEATRLKSQFLANMSHELRTPLNSIIGFTGIILQGIVGELNDEQKKQLNMVYGSAKHLLGLINDILDLSKIEAGKIEIIPSQFEVRELIRTVENMVLPMIEEKGLTSRVVIAEDVPQTIYNDKNRIKQVLINLLSNATKFTESGEIRLAVNADFGLQNAELKEEESAIRNLKSAIRFSVTDTGIGIKPEHLPVIFDEFRQIEGPLKDKPVGTGLGLVISRKMVEMMGGRIWAESEYGKGSRFQFTIPTKEIRAAKRPSVILPEALDPGKKLVLTIDDEVEAQEILNTYLKSEGYEVIQAYNAMEAMELARKYLPFAITLDIIMPGKDGWDILHELKKDPHTEGIPVICISILDNREMGLSLGAIEYMVKPIHKDQLMEELQRLEKRFRIYDILIVDDEPQAVELLTQYLGEEGNYMLRKAYGGKEGLSRIKESRPDLIILDLMMPEVDGFEVIRNLKKSEETKDIPIIIVSAKKLTQEEVGYLNTNIEKIIRKGDFSKEELFKDIKKALEGIGD